MIGPSRSVVEVADFLRRALGAGALAVFELEAQARVEGLTRFIGKAVRLPLARRPNALLVSGLTAASTRPAVARLMSPTRFYRVRLPRLLLRSPHWATF
jgi:hypothetical protein